MEDTNLCIREGEVFLVFLIFVFLSYHARLTIDSETSIISSADVSLDRGIKVWMNVIASFD